MLTGYMIKPITRYVVLCVCLASLVACNKGAGGSDSVKLETEDQKTLYAIGNIIGRNAQVFDPKPEELAFIKAGFVDGATNAKPQVDIEAYREKAQALADKHISVKADAVKKEGQDFADKVAKEKDAVKTASGVVIRTITPGSGPSPAATDIVKMHYEGKLTDGKVFDSSIGKDPLEIPLNRLVPCWVEAVQTMKKGGKAQIVCPSALAYGDRGQPPVIPGGATLSFEIELLDFHPEKPAK
jgi:FKBP-type peptidyl-prolyl cis-trans isomerase FkpA